MMKILLAAIAVLSIGAGVANAATYQNSRAQQQQGNNYNWLEGGGG